jgi:hypothetical protein
MSLPQQAKIHAPPPRDRDSADGIGARRAATMRPLQSHRYGREGEGGMASEPPPRPRRSLSSFTGAQGDERAAAELAALSLSGGLGAAAAAGASASAGSSHNGTLRRSATSSSALGVGSPSAHGASSTAGLVATLTGVAARQRSSQSQPPQPQSSDGTPDETSPNAATVGAGAAQSSSHSAAADSTAALPASATASPSVSGSTGRLKVRPQIRSWKHTKEATQDAMSNLALLASRYRAGRGVDSIGTVGSNPMLNAARERSDRR